jgi:hypothetical protein
MKFKYQRFVSLAAALTFLVVFLSSAVLYFIPDRGVMGWSGWRFLGLDKQQWDNLHITLGLLFLALILWHIYFNWKPIKAYLKVKKEWRVFTPEFNAALVLVTLFVIGTVTLTFPMSLLVNLGNAVKAKTARADGMPPFAYAEQATLRDFCLLNRIDPALARKHLEEAGITIDSPRKTLKRIAEEHHLTPRELYRIIYGPEARYPLPTDLPVGMAKRSLAELARIYRIDLKRFLEHLASYGIEATPKTTFRRLAMEHHLHPAQLYYMLLASQLPGRTKDGSH